MKAFKLFSMAVAALILGACSNEDNEVQESPQQARMIPFEATIGPASGANTRTVITEGTGTYEDYLMVAWKGDEDIALVHNGIRDKVTVTKVNSDGSAVVTGSITALGSEGEAAKLVYPYDAVGSADGGTTYTPNTSTDFLAPGFAQDGTLDYIGNNDLDGRVGDGKLYTEGGKITIKKSATEDNVVMESKTAIWKLTLTTDGTTPLEAKQVSFYIENHLIAATSVASTGKSEWTLCVAPAALSEYTGDFTILATAGSDSYAYLKPGGITLENGKYYQSTVTMTKQFSYRSGAWNSSTKTVDFTSLIADNPTEIANDYTGTISSGWYAVTGDNVAIDGDITLSGDTYIILCDGAKLTINGYINAYSGTGYALKIYGQGEGTGQLIISTSVSYSIIYAAKLLEIHGGDVAATTSVDGTNGIEQSPINVFGGKLTASSTSTGNGNAIYSTNQAINIYGGEVTASAKSYYSSAIQITSATLTVYGGKLIASNTSDESKAIYGKVMSGTEDIKFYWANTKSGLSSATGNYYDTATMASDKKWAKAE